MELVKAVLVVICTHLSKVVLKMHLCMIMHSLVVVIQFFVKSFMVVVEFIMDLNINVRRRLLWGSLRKLHLRGSHKPVAML